VEDYQKLVKAGTAGITVFQETYIESAYGEFHPPDPSAIFNGVW
jgi:2-iminoacetate synthase ThiH